MPQGVLPFQYRGDQAGRGMTAFGGLGVYLDMLAGAKIPALADREIGLRGAQGHADGQMVVALVVMNLAGGEGVRDVEALEQDAGLRALVRRVEQYGRRPRERQAQEQRWRRARSRAFPSQSAIFRCLAGFHDENQEARRTAPEAPLAFIPAANQAPRGLRRVNQRFIHWVQGVRPERTATLDMDATLVETEKREALYGYKGHQAYQPFQVYWAEQALLVDSEFRDGNVPAGHEQSRLFTEALAALPPGVEEVRLRSDTAGYQQDALLYCGEGTDPRFGVIPFAVGADMTQALRQAVAETPAEAWQPLEEAAAWGMKSTGQEWAEVCFVPNWVGHAKRLGVYRYLAVREPVRQSPLPGMESQLSFEALSMEDGRAYKVTALVTNRDLPGEALISWCRGRCGKSEEVHSILKSDLAGGRLPSGSFGENAAWWAIAVLSSNLESAMKQLGLGAGWARKRLKAVRHGLINVPGRVVEHGRQLLIRLRASRPGLAVLLAARATIRGLAGAPSG